MNKEFFQSGAAGIMCSAQNWLVARNDRPCQMHMTHPRGLAIREVRPIEIQNADFVVKMAYRLEGD